MRTDSTPFPPSSIKCLADGIAKKNPKLPYRNQKKKMTPGVGHTSPNYLFGEANHCNYLWNALAEDFIEAQKEIEESAN